MDDEARKLYVKVAKDTGTITIKTSKLDGTAVTGRIFPFLRQNDDGTEQLEVRIDSKRGSTHVVISRWQA